MVNTKREATRKKLEETIKLFFSDPGVLESLRVHYANLKNEIDESDLHEPQLYLRGLTKYEQDVAMGVLILNSLDMLNPDTIEYLASTEQAQKIRALVSYPAILERVFPRERPGPNQAALAKLVEEQNRKRDQASARAALRRGDATYREIIATILTKESFRIPRGLKMAGVLLAGAVYMHLLRTAYLSTGEPLPDPPLFNSTGPYPGPVPIMGPYGGTIPVAGGGPGVYTPPPQCWFDNGGKFTEATSRSHPSYCPDPMDEAFRAARNKASWDWAGKTFGFW